ncbi:MAG: hypothetical protein DMF83_05530 [Acidobacteria bacterium]|nr:MAG: hypothetical protein DMF83_05530 [Acidobacteriota bacterium]
MPREYKLRLGDGTVLAVDEQGLRTWAVDGQAMVQTANSQQWRPLKEVLAEAAASRPGPSSPRGRLDDGIPLIPLKPIDGEPSSRAAARGTAPDEDGRARTPKGLLGAVSAWVARLTARPGAPPAVLPVSEPSLRLASAEEESEIEDLYEDETGESVFGVVWLWVKRLVLIAGFAAAGVVAVNTWRTWLPVVTQVGLVVFTKVDEYVHPDRVRAPRAEDERQQQIQEALQRATGQLPHLSRETIELVMSRNVWSVPDPPEVFSRGYAAAKRGSSTLAPGEADELRTLEAALLAGLRPAERQRVREYDRARRERATLPGEDREILGLFARGTRALPTLSREHLQVLYGKAIAAGLASGGA